MNYQYKFVSVPIEGEFLTGNLKPTYQAVIEEMAQDGWRFVQAIVPTISAGFAEKGDLIFERPASTENPISSSTT